MIVVVEDIYNLDLSNPAVACFKQTQTPDLFLRLTEQASPEACNLYF